MTVHRMLAGPLPAVALLAAAGFLAGAAYMAWLRGSVRLSAAAAAAAGAWPRYVWLAPVRIGAAALFFTFAVRWGLSALLAAFAGFLLARGLAVRAARRSP